MFDGVDLPHPPKNFFDLCGWILNLLQKTLKKKNYHESTKD